MEFKDNSKFQQQIQQQESNISLFVSDFNDTVTLDNLWTFFNCFRDKIIQIIINKSNKLLDIYQQRSKNATVYFVDPISATDAIKSLNLKKLNGRTVRVMWHDNNHSNRYNAQGNLFIKNVPENVTPREFYEKFLVYGEIVSAKLNEDDEGKHYGYGYVHYVDSESANNAVAETDGKEIWKGAMLEVRNFVKKNERAYEINRNIYVKNFPQEFTEHDLNKIFGVYGPISYSKVLTDVNTKKKFAIVGFENEDSMNNAIQNANGKKLGDSALYVVSLMKKQDRQRFLNNTNTDKNFRLSSNTKYCNLHIRNIPFNVKENELYDNFVIYGEIKSVKIAKMILVTKEKNETKEVETSKGFGYVCFTNQESAKYAMEKMNNGFLVKHENWKRPLIIEYFMSKRERMEHLKHHQSDPTNSGSIMNPNFMQPNYNVNQRVLNNQVEFPQGLSQQNYPQHIYQQQPQIYPQPNFQQQPQIYPQPNFQQQPQIYPQSLYPNQNTMYQQPNIYSQQVNMMLNYPQQEINPSIQQFPQQRVNKQQNAFVEKQPQQFIQHPGFNNMNNILKQETKPAAKNTNQIMNQKIPEDEPDLNYLFSLDDDFARKDYLGEFIFKKIEKHQLAEKKSMSMDTIGKITGMILGIEDIKEITETCRNNVLLTNRIIEALELMESNN